MTPDDLRLNGDDFFDRWHEDGDAAFAILQDGCDIPPSLEVFEHGLEEARRRSGLVIPVQRQARLVVDAYERGPDL